MRLSQRRQDLARTTIRLGRREIESGVEHGRLMRRPGAGRPSIESSQPGVKAALEKLVDPLTRGDPCSPLRWTCKSRAKLTGALVKGGWQVSSTTVGRLLHELGYSLQSVRKSREGASHPDRNASSSTSTRPRMKAYNTTSPWSGWIRRRRNWWASSRTRGASGSQRTSPRRRWCMISPTMRAAKPFPTVSTYGPQRGLGERGSRPRHPRIRGCLHPPMVEGDGKARLPEC